MTCWSGLESRYGSKQPVYRTFHSSGPDIPEGVNADFPGGSDGKNPPAMWETRVLSLGWEGPLEKGMATHSSILVWRIPWTEEPGKLQSMGSQEATCYATE